MDSRPLTIAYGGSLNYFEPSRVQPNGLWSKLKGFFWTYNHHHFWSKTRSAYYLFKAIEHLKNQSLITPNQLQVQLWGMIDQGNQILCEKLQITDFVQIQGMLDRHISLEKLNKADVCFLPLELSAKGHKSLFIPGKVFEYLNLEKPILTLAQTDADCAGLIRPSGLGVFCAPTNVDQIAAQLLDLIENKGSLHQKFKANKSYIGTLSADQRAKDLSAIFDELTLSL